MSKHVITDKTLLLQAKGQLKRVESSSDPTENPSAPRPKPTPAPRPKPTPSPRKKPTAAPRTQTFELAQKKINEFVKGKVYKQTTLLEAEANILASQADITRSLYALNSKKSIKDSINDLTTFLDDLDNLTDLQVGIIRTTHHNQLAHIGSKEESTVILRDARNQIELQKASPATSRQKLIKDKKEDVPWSMVTVITGQARGMLKLLEMDTSLDKHNKSELQNTILQTLKQYSQSISTLNSQSERSKMAREFNTKMGALIRNSGMEINGASGKSLKRKELEKVMVYARDFTNFEAKDSPSIITITSNIANDKENPSYAVTASVPLKPVGGELAKYYENLPNQTWFKNLSKIDKAFVETYKDKIISGKYMIPTQLREVVGIKNGYLEQTSVIDKQGKTSNSAILIRSATLAHNLGVGSDSLNITKETMSYGRDLSGGKNIEMDTLNHNLGAMLSSIVPDIRSERMIQKTMRASAKSFEIVGGGVQFHNHPVSIALDKTGNMTKAAELYIKSNEESQNAKDDKHLTAAENKKKRKCFWMSCKSGKDRTGVQSHECIMSWLSKKSSNLNPNANLIVAKASHQEELAARNTRGVFGLKVKTILMGLKTKAQGKQKATYLAQIGRAFENKISYNNAVKLDLHDPSFFSKTKGTIKGILSR